MDVGLLYLALSPPHKQKEASYYGKMGTYDYSLR